MRSKILIILLVSGFLTGISGCGMMSKKYLKTNSEEHTISTVDKKKIKLENISGDIIIKQGNDSSQMTVSATKEIKVKKKDLDKPFDEINIKINSGDNEIIIKTEYNYQRQNSIFKFDLGKMANVDYVITVPPGIEISLDNVNGNVTSDRLDNDLTINLVNGKVSLDNYSGILQCEIVNGSFTGEIINTKGVDINTVNGGIKLNLNNFINAELRAETVNGKISDSDLEIREADRKKRFLKGYLGSGTPDALIKVSTVNGKIVFTGTNEI